MNVMVRNPDTAAVIPRAITQERGGFARVDMADVLRSEVVGRDSRSHAVARCRPRCSRRPLFPRGSRHFALAEVAPMAAGFAFDAAEALLFANRVEDLAVVAVAVW